MNAEAQNNLALVGAVSGLVVAVSGLASVWYTWDRDRVKLAVTSGQNVWGGAIGAAEAVFSIRVENRGNFAVTIEEAGITFENEGAPEIVFGSTVTRGEDIETDPLPLRIEPHQAITLSGGANDVTVQQCRPKYAYVKTGSGIVVRSTNLAS